MKNLLIIPAILACFTLSAIGDIITPVEKAVTGSDTDSTTTVGSPRDIDAAIDSSGLSSGGTSGDILTETVTVVGGDDHWLSSSSAMGGSTTSTTEVITFDLGGIYDIDAFHLWPYIRSQNTRGLASFDLSFSSDGTTFSDTITLSGWAIGPTGGTAPVQTQSFTAVPDITHVRMTNLTTHGSTSYVAIAEIRLGGQVSTVEAGPVDPGTSTVVASPTEVLADGSTSTITVTLKDASGLIVIGENVTLTNTSGSGTPTISPSATLTTDAGGQAVYTVSSGTVDTEVFTATSFTDSVVVNQTASVDFQDTTVAAGTSTVSASPTAVIANGVLTSTITVTVKNVGGLPIPGKLVSLSGDGSATIDTAGVGSDTTDANGVATFTVSSIAAGTEVFTATSESVTITETASVDFTEVPSGPYITPVGASSVSSNSGGRVITATIDGSGLSDVLDPASELDDVHPYIASGGNYWLSSDTAPNEELTFNLGGSYDVDGVYHWMYTRDNRRNIKTFDISFSTDGGATFSDPPVSAASLNMADWSQSLGTREDSYAELRTFDTLAGITHIRFTNIQAYGGDLQLLGLHEIRFRGISTGGGSPYGNWAPSAPDNLFEDDKNGDGVKNGLAFLLGAANATDDATGLLPSVTESTGDLVLTFSMRDSASRGTASLTTQHSADLGQTDAWNAAGNEALVPEGPGTGIVVGNVSFDVSENGGDPNLNDVIATIPASEANGGDKLFGRVNATE